jgi:hypothetical protein
MVVTLSNNGNIIFAKMNKFQRWIVERNVEWVKHVNVFNITLSFIQPLAKEIL